MRGLGAGFRGVCAGCWLAGRASNVASAWWRLAYCYRCGGRIDASLAGRTSRRHGGGGERVRGGALTRHKILYLGVAENDAGALTSLQNQNMPANFAAARLKQPAFWRRSRARDGGCAALAAELLLLPSATPAARRGVVSLDRRCGANHWARRVNPAGMPPAGAKWRGSIRAFAVRCDACALNYGARVRWRLRGGATQRGRRQRFAA